MSTGVAIVEAAVNFEPIDDIVETTRQMLNRAATDIEELLVTLVQFEIDIACVEDSPEGQKEICQVYRSVYQRWA